ncbi:MAG: hypothetical protein GXZ07_08345 [Firmicutes bacterium]|nr:hypothetical protein [Bacillota bacterium]
MAETLHRRTLQIILFILALFFLQGFLLPRAVQAQATVSIDSISDAKVNSTVEVAVSITNPSGAAGFQFDLEYDPQIVEAIDVTAGNVLPPGIFTKNLKDAANGRIRVVGGSFDEIKENGVLCRIAFQVKSSGSTTLELKDLVLVNTFADKISSNNVSGTISTGGSGSPSGGSSSPSGGNGSPSGGSSSGNVSISTASTLPYAYRGTYYSCSLAATGGTGNNYTWERKSGSLPPGLTLGSSGNISGTPGSVGKYDFTLRVTNNGEWAEKAFTLWVIDENYQVPYLYDGSGSAYGYYDRVTFKSLRITQGSMEVILGPENMPYTMVIDSSINSINLLVSLNASGDTLYINNTRHSPSIVKSIPLTSGTNEISFYVNSSGKSSDKYFLTVYKMPGRR